MAMAMASTSACALSPKALCSTPNTLFYSSRRLHPNSLRTTAHRNVVARRGKRTNLDASLASQKRFVVRAEGEGSSSNSVSGSRGGKANIYEPLSTRTFITTESRVVAIGDLHGDLQKTVMALKIAGVLSVTDDGSPEWCGGDTIVVQLGDILDRGDNEIQILHLFLRLKEQARAAGGEVFLLNGNHESLNICGDFRYVTQGGFLESAMVAGLPPDMRQHFQAQLKARIALFAPGGPIAQELAKSYVALQINDTVFAHGGIMPHHVDYGLGRLNDEMSRWMRGEQGAKSPIFAMGSPDSVLWCREYSREIWKSPVDRNRSCAILSKVLNRLKANQMVVGHTPQERGCNCACDGKIWRIDVGMSSGVCNAAAQVIEIMPPRNGSTNSEITVLTMDMGQERRSDSESMRTRR